MFVPYCVGTMCPRINITSCGLLGDLKLSISCPLSRAYYNRPVTGTKFRRRSTKLTLHVRRLFHSCSCIINPSTDYITFIGRGRPNVLRGTNRIYVGDGGVCSVYRFLRSVIGIGRLGTRFPRGMDVRGDYRNIHRLRLSSPDRQGVPCFSGLHSLLSLIGNVRVFRPGHVSRYYKFNNVFTVRRPRISIYVKQSGIGSRVDAKTRCVANTSDSYLVRVRNIVGHSGLPVGAVRVIRVLTSKL